MIWQTKTVAMFIAAQAQTDGENPLIAEAEKIGSSGGQDDKRNESARENSYESIMMTLGNPSRWSGGH